MSKRRRLGYERFYSEKKLQEKFVDPVTALESKHSRSWGCMMTDAESYESPGFDRLDPDVRIFLFRLIRKRQCEDDICSFHWNRWFGLIETFFGHLSRDPIKILLEYIVEPLDVDIGRTMNVVTSAGFWSPETTTTRPFPLQKCNLWRKGVCVDFKACGPGCYWDVRENWDKLTL